MGSSFLEATKPREKLSHVGQVVVVRSELRLCELSWYDLGCHGATL
jgi:hypothetical protein